MVNSLSIRVIHATHASEDNGGRQSAKNPVHDRFILTSQMSPNSRIDIDCQIMQSPLDWCSQKRSLSVVYSCDFVCCHCHLGVCNKPMTVYAARHPLMVRSSLSTILSSV